MPSSGNKEKKKAKKEEKKDGWLAAVDRRTVHLESALLPNNSAAFQPKVAETGMGRLT